MTDTSDISPDEPIMPPEVKDAANGSDGDSAPKESIFDRVKAAHPDIPIPERFNLFLEDWRQSGSEPDNLSRAAAALAAASNWDGDSWEFAYAFPTHTGVLNHLSDLRYVLARLGYYSRFRKLSVWARSSPQRRSWAMCPIFG